MKRIGGWLETSPAGRLRCLYFYCIMDDQIRQIAERLRGLRDVLELTPEDIARDSDISVEEYKRAETGDYDISVSMLQKIARTYNIALDALMFGEEPKMSSYFITRAGKGTSIERSKAYKYQSLAAGFMNRIADPFIVTVEPKPENEPIFYNSHNGRSSTSCSRTDAYQH